MTTLAIVSLISMLGWLALMVANYRSFNVPQGKVLRQIAIWVGLFALIAIVFKSLGFG
ncbi:hypothetical protein [Croceicoccus naphthovorans]|uniref:hypothetical protein n=1 Tax=Croceicoccus naphthovorans TaxID=1348774 RepID=UPI000A9F1D4F|nr:hypothetical protein [Croceicoccus naphthovorans]MBB3991237.1 hypothetical protein [Croceicoccus naphthovorans]